MKEVLISITQNLMFCLFFYKIGFHKTLQHVLMVKYPNVAHSDNSTSNASFIVKYLMVNTQNV